MATGQNHTRNSGSNTKRKASASANGRSPSTRTGTKSSKAKSSSRKRTSTRSNSGKSKSGNRNGLSTGQEAAGLILIAVSIWLFVTVLGYGGNFGHVFSNGLFGLFGKAAYVFPVFIVLAVIFMFFSPQKHQVIAESLMFFVLFLSISLLAQLLFAEYEEGASFSSFYVSGRDLHAGGGALGGFLQKLLEPNLGRIASYAVGVVVLILMVVLLSGRSFFGDLRSAFLYSKDAGIRMKEAVELTPEEKEERAKRREEKARIREEKKELKQEMKRMDRLRSGVTTDTYIGGAVSNSTQNSSNDEMREIRFGQQIKPTEKEEKGVSGSLPVLSSIENELNKGFFSNTKVERVYPNRENPQREVFHSYEEEESGQQSFRVEKVNEETIRHEDRESLRKSPAEEASPVKEKATKLKKEETAAEVSSFAKEAEHQNQHLSDFKLPPLSLLKRGSAKSSSSQERYIQENRFKLEQTLQDFGVDANVVGVEVGPAVTRYEIQLRPGVKVSKITNLTDDIKLSLAAADIRIEAPIPGKSAVGIEVPNPENETIMLRDLLENTEYQNSKSKIAFAVGKDISGSVLVADITKMPHMLIAGATGSGKSVCINTLIMSILFKYSPEEVKLIMIDPKVVELSVYNGIPHLLSPVVTDMKKAAGALNWSVLEMERRYQLFAESNVRDLKGYNDKVRSLPEADDTHVVLPQIVIIVDELADLMMVASNDVENAICRLAQKARAAGMHLILATQRPSVDVITGLIKANMPSRIAFSVSSGVDSRTILDMNGAERLLGKGDMLFYPQGYSAPRRVQGAFVSDEEVEAVVDYLKDKNETGESDESLTKAMEHPGISEGGSSSGMPGMDEGRDELFLEAGRFIYESERCTVGALQRRFRIGFNRAARIVDQLEEAGVVGPSEGTKPREIIMSPEQFEEYVEEYV